MSIVNYPYARATRVSELKSFPGVLVHARLDDQELLCLWKQDDIWYIIPLSTEQLKDFLEERVSLGAIMSEVEDLWLIDGQLKEPLSFEQIKFSQYDDPNKPDSFSFYHPA